MPPLKDRVPRLGSLFGAAYDRAFAATIRSWRVVGLLIALVVIVGTLMWRAFTITLGMSFATALLAPWSFFALANAMRVVYDPAFTMDWKKAMKVCVAGLTVAAGLILIPWLCKLGIDIVLREVDSNTLVADLTGAAIGIFICGRLICAPVLAAQGVPGPKAVIESVRVTSGVHLRSFVLLGLNIAIAYAVIIPIAGALWAMVYLAAGTGRAYSFAPALDIVGSAAYAFGEMYVVQAFAMSACMWLKALQEARVAETPSS
jgi:hypothetical protein